MTSDIEKAKIGLKIAEETIELMKDTELEKSISDSDCLKESSLDYYQKMSDESYLLSALSALEDGEKSREKLLKKIKTNRLKKQNTIKLSISFAASIIVAFGLITFYNNYLSEKESIKKDVISNIYTNVSAPTLVLDNGEEIIIDDKITKDTKIKSFVINNKSISYKNEPSDTTFYNKLIIPNKFVYHLTLADGSEVILNAGSILSYPTNFNGNERRVELIGEAYFKVNKSDKPFIVSTKDIDIQVYGTEFNVCTTKRGISQAILVHGSVGVTLNGSKNDNKMLKPNQMYSYNAKSNHEIIKYVNVDNYIAWLENDFNYEQIELDFFLEKVSAWYGVKFILDSNQIKDINIDICTNRNSSIDELINMLQKITNLKFIKENEKQYTVEIMK